MPSLLETLPVGPSAVARVEGALLNLDLPREQLDRLRTLLESAPDPEASVLYLAGLRQANPAALRRMLESSSVVKYFVTVTSFSRFLSDEILQNPAGAGRLFVATAKEIFDRDGQSRQSA